MFQVFCGIEIEKYGGGPEWKDFIVNVLVDFKLM